MPKGKYPRKGRKNKSGAEGTIPQQPQISAENQTSAFNGVLVRLTTLQNRVTVLENQIRELSQALAQHQEIVNVQSNQLMQGLKSAMDRVNAQAQQAAEHCNGEATETQENVQ